MKVPEVVRPAARSLRRRVDDAGDRRARRRSSVQPARPELGLTSEQLYPEGEAFHEVLRRSALESMAGLDAADATFAAMGSCFAEEFARHMTGRGLRYMVAEPNVFDFSAAWGRVYTVATAAQIVGYSTRDSFPVHVQHGVEGWFDPLREHSVGRHDSEDEARAAIAAHRSASREVLAGTDVLVLTLGQNETWWDAELGMHWPVHPKRLGPAPDPGRFSVRHLTVDENRDLLEGALDALFALNPGLRVVLTVSPVPAFAVFSEPSVITASMAGKAALRVVADIVTKARPERVFYFPSFEAVLAYNPDSFRTDNRHVRAGTVGRILSMLDAACGWGESKPSTVVNGASR